MDRGEGPPPSRLCAPHYAHIADTTSRLAPPLQSLEIFKKETENIKSYDVHSSGDAFSHFQVLRLKRTEI
jgi:hypothetical protein